MQFVDKAFARRLESGEEMPQVLYARSVSENAARNWSSRGRNLRRTHGVRRTWIAHRSGDRSRAWTVRSRSTDLDRVEQFYRAHKAPSQVDLCPLHEPGGLRDVQGAWVRDRGVEQRVVPETRSERERFHRLRPDARFGAVAWKKPTPRVPSWRAHSFPMAPRRRFGD